LDPVGFGSIEKPIGEVMEGDHANAGSLLHLRRAQRLLDDVSLDHVKRAWQAQRDAGR
jgi:hypothetical protein